MGLWYPDSLDGLESLEASHVVVTSAKELDPRALTRLHPSVRTLDVFGPAFPPGSIDASSTPGLEHLMLPWALFDASGSIPPALKTLAFVDDSPSSISDIPDSPNLRKLSLWPAPQLVALDGLERFPGLRELEVSSARLRDLEGLVGAPALEILRFDACRGIPTIAVISQLTRLHRLALLDCGDVPSLGPLAGHPSLTELVAYGTTRVTDGDLAPLLTVPGLKRLILASRRAYRPSVAEIRRTRGLGME